MVDDDPDFCSQLKASLESNKFCCYILHSAENIVEIIRQEEIPIVLLDVMLPKVSGFEACRRIRINRDVYNTGIIFLTVMGDKEEMDHGLAQGGDDYLVKPISVPVLITRVNRLLDTILKNPLFDRLTGLGSLRFLRLEIQRSIFLQKNFSIIYIEIGNFHSLQNIYDDSILAKLVRTFAYHAKLIGKKHHVEDMQLGYLGKGHFIALLNSGNVEGFVQEIKKEWESSVPEICKQNNIDVNIVKDAENRMLFLTLCGMHCHSTPSVSVNGVLESLQKLYLQCKAKSKNGVLIDRRIKG